MVTVRIGRLEQTQYDPLALLLHIATDEPRYRRFRNALDVTVVLAAEEAKEPRTITIGELLAERLQQADMVHTELIAGLNTISVKSLESELKEVIDALDKNEHLCNLLRSDIGRRWLTDIEFRHMLGQASKSTLGERQETGETGAELSVVGDDPIRQLLENMVLIEPGTFDMGSAEFAPETPVHKVALAPFAISAMPVTQAQYKAIMKDNPSRFVGADHPVEFVSWDQSVEFCRRLSESTERQFALPSEAQWEYACRAGSAHRYYFGDDAIQLGAYAWYQENSERTTHAVGKKKPNSWGLYDMHGNVWEWVDDDWHDSYERAPDDGEAWKDSPQRGSGRVIRGGSWDRPAVQCRCSVRLGRPPIHSSRALGFRVVLVPSSVAKGGEGSEVPE